MPKAPHQEPPRVMTDTARGHEQSPMSARGPQL